MSAQNPLLRAIELGETAEVLRWIQEEPTLLRERAPGGASVLQWAAYLHRSEIVEALGSAWPDWDLYDAATTGNSARLAELLQAGADPNSLSPDGFLPLCLAAAFGHGQVVEALLQAGADPNFRSQSLGGVAPLDSAIFGGDIGVIELLLKAGADPHAAQSGGFRPLHGAAQSGRDDLVQLLLKYHADPRVRDDEGRTAADWAQQSGHDRLAEFLQSGAAESE